MKNAKKPQPAESAPAERISFTLYAKDAEIIKRLRGGLFEESQTIATTSELIRFLLRAAPEKLNAKRYHECREEMKAEDGRGRKGK